MDVKTTVASIDYYTEIADPDDDNVDVHVRLESGERYVATFFTLRNIQGLMDKDKKTGEGSGKYFWASDMVIVLDLNDATIRKTVEEMIANGEFEHAFSGPLPD